MLEHDRVLTSGANLMLRGISTSRSEIGAGLGIRPTGLEPVTPRSEVWCSIQLSYGRVVDSRRIRWTRKDYL